MNSGIVRIQAKYEVLCEKKYPVHLYSPRENFDGEIFVCSHAGEILKFKEEEKQLETATISMGQPNSKT